MKIHGVEVHTLDKVNTIYPNLVMKKRIICDRLAAQGYLFMAGHQTLDTSRKWSLQEPVRIARSSQRKPECLWALMPEWK